MNVPTIGHFVRYTLNEQDAARIAELRQQREVSGNLAEVGQVYPMLIVRTWGDKPDSAVNGQVFLDGNDVLWVTSRSVGEGPGRFAWPVW